jgi:hypothetical protein
MGPTRTRTRFRQRSWPAGARPSSWISSWISSWSLRGRRIAPRDGEQSMPEIGCLDDDRGLWTGCHPLPLRLLCGASALAGLCREDADGCRRQITCLSTAAERQPRGCREAVVALPRACRLVVASGAVALSGALSAAVPQHLAGGGRAWRTLHAANSDGPGAPFGACTVWWAGCRGGSMPDKGPSSRTLAGRPRCPVDGPCDAPVGSPGASSGRATRR